MMENRSYHSLSNSWDFTTGSKRSTPDQTHELVHDMEEGRAIPGYVRVAPDLVDFNVLSTSRAGIVTTLAGPSTSVVKSGRLIQLRHGDVKRGETPPSTQFSPSLKRSKRVRSVNLSNQIPICQVYGCNLNLSYSKEYHKKHKVCEMHSKTAKVIVNGLEQRFCQQCSRFHLLAEFDDGKRSCRKRLAGHNQRRRKPQIEHRDYGHKFVEMIPSSQTPFLCANILSSGIGHDVKYGTMAKGHSCVKAEPHYNYLPSSLALIQHGNSKQLSTFQASLAGICSEDSERYSLDHLARASSSSQAQLMKTFTENESFFATQEITSVSDTGCVLSLLSTQPHNFSIQASGVTTYRPLFAQNDHRSAHSNANPLTGTVPSYSQFSSTSVASNRFFSSGHNHMNVDHLGALPASDASNTDIRDHIAGTASSLDCMDEKNGMYTHQGTSNVGTIHLSSQLLGMNSKRSSMQVKMVKEDFMSCIGL